MNVFKMKKKKNYLYIKNRFVSETRIKRTDRKIQEHLSGTLGDGYSHSIVFMSIPN